MAMIVGADVTNRVGGCVGMAVVVTVKAGHALAGFHAAAIFGCIELLLREGRHQQSHTLQLLGIQTVFEHAAVVGQCDQFPTSL